MRCIGEVAVLSRKVRWVQASLVPAALPAKHGTSVRVGEEPHQPTKVELLRAPPKLRQEISTRQQDD